MYEQLRPVVLFGETAGERAKEMNAAQRTLARKADDFEQHGMLSRFSSGKPREGIETARNLPPDMRQLIVDVHAELQRWAGEILPIFATFSVLLQKFLSQENEASKYCKSGKIPQKWCISCLFFSKNSVKHPHFDELKFLQQNLNSYIRQRYH